MAKKLAKNLVENEGAAVFNSLKEAGVTYTAFDESAIFAVGDIIKFPKTEKPKFYKVPIKGTDKFAVCILVEVNGEEKRLFPAWFYKTCKNEETGEIVRPSGSVYAEVKKSGDPDKIIKGLYKSGGSIKLSKIEIVNNYKYSNNKQGTGAVRSFDFVE